MQALFLLLALRELLPERPGLVLCAFVFGAFLPMQLYIFQFVADESWVAMLSSGALVDDPPLRRKTSAAWGARGAGYSSSAWRCSRSSAR